MQKDQIHRRRLAKPAQRRCHCWTVTASRYTAQELLSHSKYQNSEILPNSFYFTSSLSSPNFHILTTTPAEMADALGSISNSPGQQALFLLFF